MPKALLKVLEKTRVANKAIQLRPFGTPAHATEAKRKKTSKPKSAKGKPSGEARKPRKRKVRS